jgi:acyl carrier protein
MGTDALMQDVEARVLRVAADCLGRERDRVAPGDRLVADLGASSVDLIDLAFRLEREFEVVLDLLAWASRQFPHLPPAELRQALTLRQVFEAVWERLAAGAAPRPAS